MYKSPLSELVVICWVPRSGHCWPLFLFWLCIFTCVCNLMHFLLAQPILDGPSPHFLLSFLLFSDLSHVWRNLKYFYSGSLHLFFPFHSYVVGVSLNWFWVSVPVLTLQRVFLSRVRWLLEERCFLSNRLFWVWWSLGLTWEKGKLTEKRSDSYKLSIDLHTSAVTHVSFLPYMNEWM